MYLRRTTNYIYVSCSQIYKGAVLDWGRLCQSYCGESMVDRGGGSVLGFYSDSVGDVSCGFLSSRLAARGGFSGCPQKLP
ncbi:unnamed protein product [Microthlaspi erraticum]|uniref:Uncharacterized protein n=1 Tax=Microthlaspi erraticum TaxID=1685480 RepID=A0A6D2I778_9BRAS|nr:unnamed protein product [Microthlaspi erraticum]